MRITYIKLTGYIGIYNGLGLNELEIDLSPGTHKITVISGINGCGKSTLLKAMSILPDSSSDFIPNVPAEKRLRIEDGATIYDICITSAAGKNGSRGVSKASIKKNGVELNPNGNISSYKDIVFDEFELDSNYITLCRLSSDDRGLADKSPAERKKFMTFIVDSLDTYNAIYKNLNKKSSVFKSYINNLHNKIQNIGDEDAIRASNNKLKSDAAYIESTITNLNNQIVAASATISNLDPNGTLQNEYSKAQDDTEVLKRDKDRAYRTFSGLISRLFKSEDEDLDALIEGYDNSIMSKEKILSANDQKKMQLISRSEELTKNINDTNMRIYTLSSEVDPNLSKEINRLREDIQSEMNSLSAFGITDPDEISKEELELVLNVIETVIGMIDHLYIDMTDEKMDAVMNFYNEALENIENKIAAQNEIVHSLSEEVESLNKDKESISYLDQRPKGCKIDDCPFIKNAYELWNTKYKNDSIDEKLNKVESQLNNVTAEANILADRFNTFKDASTSREYLDRIRDLINSNRGILSKVAIGQKFINEFEKRVSKMNSFNDYRDLDDLKENIVALTYYKRDTKSLRSLEEELSKQSNSEILIKELKERLTSFQDEKEEVDEALDECMTSIDINQISLTKLNSDRDIAIKAREAKNEYISIGNDLDDANRKLNDILTKSKDCVALISKQGEDQQQINDLSNRLTPINDQISRYEGQLMMLDQYKSEYSTYSKKYDMVEVLKKYSSPTTGIQTVFMDLYMSKTLELANNVLGMIFGGQYRLLDYVINANEFRMPFIGSGMVVDDISSGSTSQVCMMGMVMNLVLKYQASPVYNIASLDEIDGGLDTRNRLEFISVLYKLIDILNIDQLFIISHSLEIELSNVNIIKLKSYDDFGDSTSLDEGCCVLYDFNSMRH